jgi:diguanylate cyclase (GGDEF)-like protein
MALARTPYHVLLIEEDPKQAEIYLELIREVADCKVDVMTQMESTFDWVGRSNYHLVVVDGESGLPLLEQIKRLSPVTSVILISEHAAVEQAVAAIRMGAEDYLKKPFNPESFQLAVKRGLDRKTVFGENAGASSFLNLLNSCQMISASLDSKKIFGIIRSYLSRELKSGHSAIYSLQGGVPVRIEGEGSGDRAMEEVLEIALHASNPLRPLSDSQEFYRFVERGQLTPGLFLFKFHCGADGDSAYFCVCLSPERPAAMDAFESRLRLLKAQIEVTGKNIEHYSGVQHLVYVDDATGLYNTRYLHNILDREIPLAHTSGRSFAVLFIDADRFKGVNDAHGHRVGTKLLNELGSELKRFVRESDTVFRYGGDEFVAVLSPCDLATARAVAERIRQSVEAREFLADEGLKIHFTVSIGVALFPDHARSKKEIIDAADQAMYSAKRTTRNAVTVAPLRVLEGQPAAAGETAPEPVAPGLKRDDSGKGGQGEGTPPAREGTGG